MNKTVITSLVIILLVVGVGWSFINKPSKFAPYNDFPDSNQILNNNQSSDLSDGSSVGSSDTAKDTKLTDNNKKIMQATMHTSKGDIEIEFGTATPKTVENFIKLAKEGFYDGVKFHRVIKGFMIQAGDPQSKDDSKMAYWGTGGPGYKFDDELTGKEQYPQGTLAMANSGPNTNGSQFFIVTATPGAPLPPSYTVFGKVTKGIENALAIENVKTGQADRPIEAVTINSITLK
ncbi:MAG: peptidylprolyl isomerase [Candidatus Nomurabacteria bacterium]|nr:peptidylprolyl isomerase [Candidatus Nomurabacteria bacterium]